VFIRGLNCFCFLLFILFIPFIQAKKKKFCLDGGDEGDKEKMAV